MLAKENDAKAFQDSLRYFQKAAEEMDEKFKRAQQGQPAITSDDESLSSPETISESDTRVETDLIQQWKQKKDEKNARRSLLSLGDLSEFKERIGIVHTKGSVSLREGLDQVDYSSIITKARSFSTGLENAGLENERVEEILSCIKHIRQSDMGIADTPKKVKNKAPRPPLQSIFSEHCYENLNDNHYENVKESSALYDEPRKILYETITPESHYENVKEPTYMNVSQEEKCLYENLGSKSAQYDVPRSAKHIYDSPKAKSQYDVPKTTNQCLVPQASQILLEKQREELDADSLDGDDRPEIPSPDYGSEEESCDYVDEGLESDARSFYNDEQGLEVIFEVPEEEDLEGKGSECHSSEEESGSSGIHSDATPVKTDDTLKKERGEERDRAVEVYPETVRQRKLASKDGNKMNIQRLPNQDKTNTEHEQQKDKKFLPSVKVLRSQFENKPQLDQNKNVKSGVVSKSPVRSLPEEIQPIYNQFGKVDEELLKPKQTTLSWDPIYLLQALYKLPEALPAIQSDHTFINLEGWLEKLPSGRKKATFWNAWKRRYFRLKDGYLSYSTNSHNEKPSMVLQLLGGRIDSMDNTMLGVDDGQSLVDSVIGIDDGKGHYVVVRCGSKDSTERWKKALVSHTVEDYNSAYTQPWPHPRDPHMLRDTIIIDLGSHSVRAGILATQPTLPQVFFPAVIAFHKQTGKAEFGFEALAPDVRQSSQLHWPARPTSKINKYSVELAGVTGLLKRAFMLLNVDPRKYNIQLVAARSFNASTLVELTSLLIDKFGVMGVNITHQALLTLWAYNATSGVSVDIGERIDVVPITDGYVVKGGVSKVPYGGSRIVDHLRHFLLQKHYSMVTDVEAYLIHHILESTCYSSLNYTQDLASFKQSPGHFEQSVPVAEFFTKDPPWSEVTLDCGRFQATEGLFNPSAWGLDNLGIHKLVHKAIQECGVDMRRELSRNIFLSGGVTMLPGFPERLQAELTRVMPTLTPKVHASSYRYHAAYLGACQLANSPGFNQSKVSREEWSKKGKSCVSRWTLL